MLAAALVAWRARRSPRRRLLWAVVGAALVAPVVLAVPGLVAGLGARSDLRAAEVNLDRTLDQLQAGDLAHARQSLSEAGRLVGHARAGLDRPWVGWGRALPVWATNLAAARQLVRSTDDVIAAVLVVDRGLAVDDGARSAHDLAEQLEAVAPDLARAATTVRDARADVARLDSALLVPQLRTAAVRVNTHLAEVDDPLDHAAALADLLGPLLGDEGTRRYFLAVQNSAELRATGGFIGSWGVLVAERGQLRLEVIDPLGTLNATGQPDDEVQRTPQDANAAQGRPEVDRTWQDLNNSPDFPTVGQAISDHYVQTVGPTVDGVIAIDPVGLSALLMLTGPVAVPGWPDPVTADNVVDVTLRDAYLAYDGAQAARVEFLGGVAYAVFDAMTTADLGDPVRVGRALADAVTGGHVLAWMQRPTEQALMRDLGATGAVPRVRSDSLLVVTKNDAANKADYYLRRSLDYDVTLHPDASLAFGEVQARAVVSLTNDMPATGLPTYVAGPSATARQGENRSYLSIYTATDCSGANIDGAPVTLDLRRDLGRSVCSGSISAQSGQTAILTVDLSGGVSLEPGGWYVLDLVKQPTLRADRVRLHLSVPEGWSLAETRGVDVVNAREAVFDGDLGATRTIRVRVQADAQRGLLDRLFS